MSNILAIDTTLGGCSVAHSNGAIEFTEERNQQTSQLASMTQRVMQDQAYDSLDGYAVTTGPGSFTGVRIGIAFIRGLALAHPKPIHAITTLELLAAQAMEAGALGEILAAINAHRGQLYVQSFDAQKGKLTATSNASAIEIANLPTGNFTLAGDAGSFFPDHEAVVTQPRADALARYAKELPLPNIGNRPSPLYLRAPDAKAQKGDLTIAQSN